MKKTKKISFNSLIEYIDATDARKRAIIKQQKDPKPFPMYYNTAKATCRDYFINGFDRKVIHDAISRLQHRKKTTDSDWSKRDSVNSIKALREFLSIEFPFDDLKCKFYRGNIKAYSINGVIVSVSPDLILEWTSSGEKHVGAIKFYIKQTPLEYEQGRTAASLLADFMSSESDSICKIEHEYCLVVDVFNSRCFYSPEDISHYMGIVENACTEITKNWSAA